MQDHESGSFIFKTPNAVKYVSGNKSVGDF